MLEQELVIEGHLLDGNTLPKALDLARAAGCDIEILEFVAGRKARDVSRARLLVTGEDRAKMDVLLGELRKFGAYLPDFEAAQLVAAPADCVSPDGFYSTTHHPTSVRIGGKWIPVTNPEMDKALVVDLKAQEGICTPLRKVRKGDMVVVGDKGVRVDPAGPRSEPEGKHEAFEFMASAVSSEKPIPTQVDAVVEAFRETKRSKQKVCVVLGPAVVHTGANPAVAEMIREGWIDVLFAGNALAVHDVERGLYGTSLGVDLKHGHSVPGGHKHHIYAINEVFKAGSIASLVAAGKLKDGVMYEVVKKGIPCVLAGSIRDDGPLPEVITDVVEAQVQMRKNLKGVGLVLMVSTMLHSIATGNMLSSRVRVICLDINPSTVTKLSDRGTAHAVGIVTDVGIFLPWIASRLGKTGTGSSPNSRRKG